MQRRSMESQTIELADEKQKVRGLHLILYIPSSFAEINILRLSLQTNYSYKLDGNPNNPLQTQF